MVYFDIFDLPVGQLTVVTDGQSVMGLHIVGDKYFAGVEPDWVRDGSQPLLRQVGRELAEYFAGERREFTVPVAAHGTEFQRQVWQAVTQIPWGATMSYAEIAKVIGRPKAVRAVGSAIGRNPVCILVPCHRVMGSDGSMTGYVAGVGCKEWLLRLEQGRIKGG